MDWGQKFFGSFLNLNLRRILERPPFFWQLLALGLGHSIFENLERAEINGAANVRNPFQVIGSTEFCANFDPGNSRHFAFTFVRDPISRFLAGYSEIELLGFQPDLLEPPTSTGSIGFEVARGCGVQEKQLGCSKHHHWCDIYHINNQVVGGISPFFTQKNTKVKNITKTPGPPFV